MISIPDTLDYQTVFQILGTFEAFSVWKGIRVFKADGKTNIMPEQFDDETFAALCESLKNAKNKWRELRRIAGMLIRRNVVASWGKFRNGAKVWGWRILRFLHWGLAFILRATPLVTIPALSLSYLLQIGCVGDKFQGIRIVCWFIVGKTACYIVCYIFAQILAFHVKVSAPVPADGRNILSP